MRRLVVLLLLVAGCASSVPPAAPPDAAVRSTTTAAPAASTTTVAVPFETEVKQAAIHLLAIRNDVFQHPDRARVSEYVTSFCACLDQEEGIIGRLVAANQRWDVPPVEALGVRVVDANPEEPLLVLVARQPAGDIVDGGGLPVTDVPAVDTAPYSLSLVREEGQWRLNAIDGITLDEEIVDQIISEGLP